MNLDRYPSVNLSSAELKIISKTTTKKCGRNFIIET